MKWKCSLPPPLAPPPASWRFPPHIPYLKYLQNPGTWKTIQNQKKKKKSVEKHSVSPGFKLQTIWFFFQRYTFFLTLAWKWLSRMRWGRPHSKRKGGRRRKSRWETNCWAPAMCPAYMLSLNPENHPATYGGTRRGRSWARSAWPRPSNHWDVTSGPTLAKAVSPLHHTAS